tara:strand:- start:34207 stop:35187 length:981 start_codon:yes stop_codon:yes gene_type:complete
MTGTSIPAEETLAGRKVTVIGAGVIGTSWAALFLAHGMEVIVHDPRPDVERVILDGLARIAPSLAEMGLSSEGLSNRLSFEIDLERAVRGADVIQENGPERLEFKQDLWARIEQFAPAHALLLSSSSAITATLQGATMRDAGRLLIGHPFNPPHMIPLVEVVPGEHTAAAVTEAAVEFYTALGKVPRVLHKEIRAFVANRLQRALFAESLYLVQEGVVTVDELDDIVTNSVGLRWAADGPFRSFYLGGGAGGFRGYFAQFGPGMRNAIVNTPKVTLDDALQSLIIQQTDAAFGTRPLETLEHERDTKQLAILRALTAVAGKSEGKK